MKEEQDSSNGASALRQRAEAIARRKAVDIPENLETLAPEAARQLLHELRVHQIELEMQNEELRQAQDSESGANVCHAVMSDITERQKMPEQLIVIDRLASIGEMADAIAYELNNLLTSVIGLSQLLMETDIPEDIKKDLGIIHSEAQRATGIVKNLLIFDGKHAPLKQLSQINNIIEDILRLRAYEQKVNNIEVNRCFASDLPEIMVDYFQILQVFLNIIINAEYFMTEAHNKGMLTITTERLDNIVRISFADDGPGISKENLSKIFNLFFTTKEVGKGTGLGLSICYGIIAEHGGKIRAESKLGKGATFIVELPILSALD